MAQGTMAVGGLVSGLSTDDIISKLMTIARQPETQVKAQITTAQTQLSAWQSINASVLALQTSASALADPSSFGTQTATSSDSTMVTASATSSATSGTYYVTVTSRAQAGMVGSQSDAYTSLSANVGTGSMHIAFAAGSQYSDFDVSVDSNNDTLSGLRDAINAKNGGVTASIINRGTSAAPKYQLLLTSSSSGTANAIDTTKTTTSGLTGGTAPVFNQVIQNAADAKISLGDGTDKIQLTSASNTIKDLIPGVTLNILNYDSSSSVTINVAQDTASTVTAVQSFVTQYNSLISAVNTQFQYTASTSSTASSAQPLLGDSDLQTLQMQVESIITTSSNSSNSAYKSLSTVGISMSTNGTLSVDTDKLTSALESNPDDVKKLFAHDLRSDSSAVSFLNSTNSTQASSGTGWNVNVTQAARQAQVTAGVAMGSSGTLSQPEVLTINSYSISLPTGSTLADVISAINKKTSQTGVTALATQSDGTGTGNYLTLQNVSYGSNQTLTVQSNTSDTLGTTSGFGTTAVTPSSATGQSGAGYGLPGQDVQGTINDGQSEIACTGSGQILTADPGTNQKTSVRGLSLMVTANAPMSTTVYFTKGAGSTLKDTLTTMTSSTGLVTNAEDSLNKKIANYNQQVTDMEAKLTNQESQLYTEFNNMETELSKLESQGNFISSVFGSSSSSSSSSSSKTSSSSSS